MKEKSVLVASYKERFIWLDGVITRRTATVFRKMLTRLNRHKPAPIFLYIKGTGGDYYSTILMARYVERSLSPICIVAHGFVVSGCFLLTQASRYRLAMAGTKFRFHPAALMLREGVKFIEQQEILDMLGRAKVCNAVQLSWFLRKGQPADQICRLFNNEALISLPKAIKLKLMDSYFKKEDFLKDRRIVRRLLRAKS